MNRDAEIFCIKLSSFVSNTLNWLTNNNCIHSAIVSRDFIKNILFFYLLPTAKSRELMWAVFNGKLLLHSRKLADVSFHKFNDNIITNTFSVHWEDESAPIQLAQCRSPGLAISNGKILIYNFSNKLHGNYFIKQHSETVMVWNYQNADWSLRKKTLLCHLLYFSAHFRSLLPDIRASAITHWCPSRAERICGWNAFCAFSLFSLKKISVNWW